MYARQLPGQAVDLPDIQKNSGVLNRAGGDRADNLDNESGAASVRSLLYLAIASQFSNDKDFRKVMQLLTQEDVNMQPIDGGQVVGRDRKTVSAQRRRH